VTKRPAIVLGVLLALAPVSAHASQGGGILVDDLGGSVSDEFAYKTVYPDGSVSVTDAVATVSFEGELKSLAGKFGGSLAGIADGQLSTTTYVMVDTDVTLSGDVETDADAVLVFKAGNTIATNGHTLTLNSEPEAGQWQLFDVSGGGSVVFTEGAATKALPEWWAGQLAGTETDAVVPIQYALSACAANMTVELQAGTYVLSEDSDVEVISWPETDGLSLIGAGMGRTKIECRMGAGGGYNVFWLEATAPADIRNTTFRGFTIYGANNDDNAAQTAIYMKDYVYDTVIEDVETYYFRWGAVCGSADDYGSGLLIDGCYFHDH